MPSYTLDELIEQMRPQAERDMALMLDCVDGLTLYAAQQAAADPASPKVAEMRGLIENLDGYWGLDEIDPDILRSFDERIGSVTPDAELSGEIAKYQANTVYGLYRTGEDMVVSMGDSAADEIRSLSGLIKEIASAWDFESHILDNLTAHLDNEAIVLAAERDTRAAETAGRPLLEQKLYSPVFVDLYSYDDPDSGDDSYSEEIPQTEATYYADAIHEAILEERLSGEEDRGLMTYYHDDDSVNEKVRSLFVDVEVHGGKLWAVATIQVTEPLSPEELDRLRESILGQYSDGFGEGFEQREIKVSGGEINVHLWTSDNRFFIDTEAEFSRRTGIEFPAAAHEPEPPSNSAAVITEPEDDTPDPVRDELLGRIAKKHCRFETLETRCSDSLDFREVSVWGFKAALEEAYNAGLSRQIAQIKGFEQTGADNIPATKKAPQGRAADDMPSVLAQIRAAAKEPKPRAAARDSNKKDKSGPEH